jgi:hypothetical protein
MFSIFFLIVRENKSQLITLSLRSYPLGLANSGGKMDQSRLRRHAGMRYALLNPILE